MKYYDKSLSEIQDILDNAYSEFRIKLRQKRIAPLVGVAIIAGIFATGAISGGIAGYFTSKHSNEKLLNEIQEMEKQISSIKEATKTNSEMLIGLSNQVLNIEKDFDNKLKLIKDNFRFQIEIVLESLNAIKEEFEYDKIYNELRIVLTQYSDQKLSHLKI